MRTPEIEAWLHLMRAPGLGFVRISQLLSHFGSASQILGQTSYPKDCQVPSAAARHLQQANNDDIAAELNWLDKPSNHILTHNDPLFPPQLKLIDEPPLLLYVKGSPEALLLPQLAVVGSRNATQSGLENTRHFCSDLVDKGWVITSGLAAGIDAAAHQAALDQGGQTIAVMGTGINQIYPKNNQQLAKNIVEQGAVVSELPLNSGPQAHHFPRRNRIIAGLSLGTLVIEAAKKSGTLITARQTMEQGRAVMAIPGSIHNPLAKGCHALIKQGAKLVESAQDITEELAPAVDMLSDQLRQQINNDPPQENNSTLEKPTSTPTSSLPSDQKQVLDAMGFDPMGFDDLVTTSETEAADLNSILLTLELSGWIEKLPAAQYQRLK